MIPSTMATTQTTAMDDDFNFKRLNQLCLPRWDNRINTRTLRPERPEYAILMELPSNEKWARALRQIHAAICHAEGSLDGFVKKMLAKRSPYHAEQPLLQAVAAILYDQACSSDSTREAAETELGPPIPEAELGPLMPETDTFHLSLPIGPLIEHMLLIDYGFGVHPLPGSLWVGYIRSQDRSGCQPIFFRHLWRHIPPFCRALTLFAGYFKRGQVVDSKVWKYLDDCLSIFRPLDLGDIAIMLYHYDTHRQELDRTEYEKGLTGYTGVMQELIDEVPVRGSDRLIRKLSVDVNEFIPQHVHDSKMRQMLLAAAKDLAAQHGISLCAPEVNRIRKPMFERRYKDGFPVPEQKGWMESLSDFFSTTPDKSTSTGPAAESSKEKLKAA
ncbi:hypothetical protein QBC33DRAFT_567285 [Phialemonium atrogriseum]|uniref:Uncharacterized protein n=1 Tax=Phialemonium atrogriseum TaxID=1093897 RepID=A0AAJ0C5P2_9PEZI|nr:uncharacterized protein QBC33DRAFT_567285 [Phialemonium atrogriseum]KAK1769922.1 hypothetical protein QBC33DRAFT_567285 [Phialemonium atrogriseum]